MSLKNKVRDLAKNSKNQLIEIRRHLHAHPELSFHEYQTSKYVAERLKGLGLNPEEDIAGTGVMCLIEGRSNRKIIALRADMDALPIQEENDIPYKSKNNGVMHACGHDVHTTSLLGAAGILNELKDDLSGTIKLIFQPGEEKIPGGASIMIKEGVLEKPKPNYIFGQHVMPHIEVGKVGFREGMYMASADEIYLKVQGKGGHGAMPEMNTDPVLIASHIIVAMQQIVSRNANPKKPSVLSFGKFVANGATNIIPDEVYIEGTFRAMDENWRSEAHRRIKKLAKHIAEGMGGKCEIEIKKGYPFLKNNDVLTQKAKTYAEDYLGPENVVDLDLWMAAEDFAYYSQQMDACFYRLGTGNEVKGINASVHSPNFNIDEDALEIGAGLMAWLAIQSLSDI